jgi:molybdopterin-guanine dinucleotide biosynthesis protein A
MITGIILAGGESTRMGQDKSLMHLQGKTLIQHAIDALRPVCARVVISADKSAYAFTGCETWPDLFAAKAAIVGILSALRRSASEVNFILSCDMPFVPTALVEYILKESHHTDIAVPIHGNGYIEPLCGVYRKNILTELERFIASDHYKILDFIGRVSHRLVEINSRHDFYSDKLFANINTPGDLIRISRFPPC